MFVTLSTVTVTYTAFTTTYLRTGVCEELSRQPELLRDVVDTGLSIENCEFWFERGIIAMLGLMFVLIAIRVSRSFYFYRPALPHCGTNNSL